MIITKNQNFFNALVICLMFFIPCSVYAGCNNIESDTYKLDFERQYEEAFTAGDFNRIGELKAQRMSQASASENCNEQLQSAPATSATNSTVPTTIAPENSPILMEPPPWLSSTSDTSTADSTASVPQGVAGSTPVPASTRSEETSKSDNTASANSLPVPIEIPSAILEPPPWLSSTDVNSAAPVSAADSGTGLVPVRHEDFLDNKNIVSAGSLPTLNNTMTPILMEPPVLTSAAASPIMVAPDSEQIFIPSTFTHDSRTNNELWRDAKEQLNARPSSPTLDANEFVEYIERIESQYPDATWQQVVAALHAEGYGNDVNGSTMPIFDGSLTGVPWNKFLMGPETDGYDDILNNLSASVYNAKNYRKDRITRRTPKYVTRSDGQLMDIQHSYAGLRSDLNRGADKWYNRPKSDFMRWTQTDGGDSYQEIIFAPQASWEAGEPTWSTAHAPPNQRAGNALGIWLSNYYRDPKHKKTPLSQAYRDYFESDILVE